MNADAEATKKRILQRACALISAHGIEGTSVRDVAAASEISLATVLHYYGSKEGLYQACVDAMRAERIGEIGPLLGPGPAERPTHPHGEVH